MGGTGREAMQNRTKTRDLTRFTVQDYAEELSALLDQEQEYTARLMRRISESMDVLFQTEKLLMKK